MSPIVEADSPCIFNLQINTSYPILIYPNIGIKLHNQTYDFIYSCQNNSQSHSANASLRSAIRRNSGL